MLDCERAPIPPPEGRAKLAKAAALVKELPQLYYHCLWREAQQYRKHGDHTRMDNPALAKREYDIATKLLNEVISGSQEDWVRILAFTQLAIVNMNRGSLTDAKRDLRNAKNAANQLSKLTPLSITPWPKWMPDFALVQLWDVEARWLALPANRQATTVSDVRSVTIGATNERRGLSLIVEKAAFAYSEATVLLRSGELDKQVAGIDVWQQAYAASVRYDWRAQIHTATKIFRQEIQKLQDPPVWEFEGLCKICLERAIHIYERRAAGYQCQACRKISVSLSILARARKTKGV